MYEKHKCDKCNKGFDSIFGLSAHKKIHSENYDPKKNGKAIRDYTEKKNKKIRKNYENNPKHCPECNKIIPYDKKENKFCNSSCSTSFNNKLKGGHSEETKYKISVSVDKNHPSRGKKMPPTKYPRTNVHYITCSCCGNQKWVRYPLTTCSYECALINSTYRRTVHEYEHDGKILKLDSTWEVEIALFLDKCNILWERPKHITWYDKNGKKRKFFPDFYLLEYDIYLDPKNYYIAEIQKEKLDYFSNKLSLYYGNVNYLKTVLKIIT